MRPSQGQHIAGSSLALCTGQRASTVAASKSSARPFAKRELSAVAGATMMSSPLARLDGAHRRGSVERCRTVPRQARKLPTNARALLVMTTRPGLRLRTAGRARRPCRLQSTRDADRDAAPCGRVNLTAISPPFGASDTWGCGSKKRHAPPPACRRRCVVRERLGRSRPSVERGRLPAEVGHIRARDSERLAHLGSVRQLQALRRLGEGQVPPATGGARTRTAWLSATQ